MSCPVCKGTLRDQNGNTCESCGGTGWGKSEYVLLKLVLLILCAVGLYGNIWMLGKNHDSNSRLTGLLAIFVLLLSGSLLHDLWTYIKSRRSR